MQIQQFNNPKLYYEKVKAYLLQEEAVHCMILGICNTLIESPHHYETQPYLVAIKNKDRVVAAAVRTSPRKLILSRSPQSEAIVKIAQDLATKDKSLPGVIASQPEATIFAQTWHSLTGQTYQQSLALRIHQLEAVSSLKQAKQISGYLRQATASDHQLLTTWIQDFRQEALGQNAPKSESDRWFDSKLKQDSLFVWQDQTIVSMVAYGGKTPQGIRINAVYTPPEYRQNGYATACVAAISQKLLDRGYKYCFLYTDVNNPTSNSMYQKIGYQPMCDITDYSFVSKY
ncbi:MAG: GNAT family N-acetyltransferase [Xenococcaceae cyanobacterium MO_188.B29]|nr:GNAT family N-acetyltransferase [Xenococcaceae cyanobacterium MO_188.B29]